MKKETQMMVELLNSTIPATSPLSVATEIEVLELLNIVNEPSLVEKMKSFSKIVPVGTPATLTGLLQLLRNMMHASPKATDDHRKTVDDNSFSWALTPFRIPRESYLRNLHGNLQDDT